MKKFLYPLFLIFSTIFAACDPQRIYENNEDIRESTWKKEDTLSFEFAIQDTTLPYNLYYNVRYSHDYPFYNLFTKYFLYDPQGKLIRTPQAAEDMYLFDMKTGKPYGKGLGDIYDQRISFLRELKFTASGNYKVKVVHYMRNEPLHGVVSMGVRVEKASLAGK